MTLNLNYNNYQIRISGESQSCALSGESLGITLERHNLDKDDQYQASSCHKIEIILDEKIIAVALFMASGGATGINQYSAFVRENVCYLAVGPYVCAIELPTLKLLWSTQADSATCFGIYNAANYQSIISHGELEITRLDYNGNIIWSTGCEDIYSEGFWLHENYLEAEDFNHTKYKIGLETGKSEIVSRTIQKP